MRASLILLTSLLLVSCSLLKGKATAPKEELIPRTLLFGNPEKMRPSISPDGTKIAFLAPDTQQILNVFIQNLQHLENKPQQCTSDTYRGIQQFFWQKDSKHILYLQDSGGDENWHIYQTDVQTKTTKDLTPQEGIQASPISYENLYPNEMLIQMNMRNKELFDVYRLNLKTGELSLDTENPGNVYLWIADNDLQVRASQYHSPDGSTTIQIRDNTSAPWREFLRINPDDMHAQALGFTEDGKSLLVISSYEQNTNVLQKIDIATGAREMVAHAATGDISNVLINPNTHRLEAASVETDKNHWIILDPSIAPDFKKLRTLCHGDSFSISSRDMKDQKWIVSQISDTQPPNFYLYNRTTKKSTFLFNVQPTLCNYTFAPMLPISITARDGMKLFGYLTLPLKTTTPPPMVLFVHGGPWARDSWGFNPATQWLTNRGYAVLQINFRGSTGYGKQYVNAGDHEWGGKMHTDLLDAKAWAINHGYVNPDKVAIFGGSYGGYATLVGLAFTPNEFCCGVDVVGPSNLVSLLQSIPPYWASVRSEFDIRVGDVDKDKEELISRSPFFKAHCITKPLLIAQGANDPRVNQAESDQMVAAIRENHHPVEYLLFPDEGHGFHRPSNNLCFYAAMENFLQKHLGGKCQPPTPEENWKNFSK